MLWRFHILLHGCAAHGRDVRMSASRSPDQFIDVDATRARVAQGPAVTRRANLGLRKGSLDPATWFERSNRVNGLAPSRPNLSRTGHRTLPVTLPPTTALQDDRQLPSMRARRSIPPDHPRLAACETLWRRPAFYLRARPSDR